MKYSLIAYNALTSNVIFKSEIYSDTKENMKHLNKLYDDFETSDNVFCRFKKHGAKK
tara:strand:- start:260 stop:430 length:171 start_codon:yes stop_codon:yes gene_type:complete